MTPRITLTTEFATLNLWFIALRALLSLHLFLLFSFSYSRKGADSGGHVLCSCLTVRPSDLKNRTTVP